MSTKTVNFANPTTLDDSNLLNFFSDFNTSDEKPEQKEKKEEKESSKSNVGDFLKKITSEESSDEDESSDEHVESDDSKGESKDESKSKKESSQEESLSLEEEEETEEVSPLVNAINKLHEAGLIEEAYEGFDEEEEINEDVVQKLLEHNFNKKLTTQINEFVDQFSDLTRRVMKYDFDAKGKNVDSYLRTLVEEHSIKSLDVTNEYDQEKIVRQWYEKQEFSDDEIADKLSDLKDSGKLEKEAKLIKPKLDKVAAEIASEKEKEQEQIRQFEEKMREDYNKRVIEKLSTGNVSGIKLNREDAQTLYQVLTNENVTMNVAGKEVKMPALEALIYHNKFDKKGSLENVILATLLLTNPEKFEQEYEKKGSMSVTRKFVSEHKYNNKTKVGKTNPQSAPAKEAKTWGSLKI